MRLQTTPSALVLLATMGVGAAPSLADTIHVPGDAPTIQQGIDRAVDGDVVLVASGTWTGVGNRNLQFAGRRITVRSEGGAGACTIDCQWLDRAFLLSGLETLDTRIEGFTVTHATSRGNSAAGGAIYGPGASALTIAGCAFETNGLSINGRGGAIWMGGGMVITDTSFSQCFVSDRFALGGAICAVGPVTLQRCSFTANENIEGRGGVIAAYGPLLVEDCEFVGNTGGYGGAIYVQDATLEVRRSGFTGNTAPALSNAPSLGGAVAVLAGSASLEGCAFDGNHAKGGGALYGSAAAWALRDCDFVNNSATTSGGGALLGADLTAINCLFRGNSSTAPGGAIVLGGGASGVTNCTLADNSTASPVGGGGIELRAAAVTLVSNGVLWANTADQLSTQSAQILVESGADLSIGYTCVEGLDGSLGGVGNTGADPMFVSAGAADYRLQPGSPCIDAADNGALPPDVLIDLDGLPRFLDDPNTPDSGQSGNGHAEVVDMGAYEFQPSPCAADFNGDGAVNTLDVLAFLHAWNAHDPRADFNGDGSINTIDVLAFLNAWAAGC